MGRKKDKRKEIKDLGHNRSPSISFPLIGDHVVIDQVFDYI